ncbi:hypothetical protein QJS66_00770 [Kocuria rhizophila]|nr:hypothetical protein QJS66_00770 [Kocuria rhizophila]
MATATIMVTVARLWASCAVSPRRRNCSILARAPPGGVVGTGRRRGARGRPRFPPAGAWPR